MEKTNLMSGRESCGRETCDGNCGVCRCGNCGGEMFAKLIQGRLKKAHRRFERRQDRSMMRQIATQYNNWRNL